MVDDQPPQEEQPSSRAYTASLFGMVLTTILVLCCSSVIPVVPAIGSIMAAAFVEVVGYDMRRQGKYFPMAALRVMYIIGIVAGLCLGITVGRIQNTL